MAKQLSVEIENILSGAIGEFFAQATVKKSCEAIGVKPGDLNGSNLPELADRIEKSVAFIKGKDLAAQLAGQIRRLSA